MSEITALPLLYAEIEARVQAIRTDHPEWLCAKGCAGCCRRLAAVPQLTAAEWDLLQQGLAALAPQRLGEVRRNIEALSGAQSSPVTCPLLDRTTNACLVYAQRPVACRTYGFYVQRDLGLYCADIESSVARGELDDVVWGNHDRIDQRLAAIGEARALTEWFAREENGS